MQAVQWIDWMKNPTRKPEKINIKATDLLWEDEVTQTIFTISNEEYEKHLTHIKQELQTLDAKQCYEQIWKGEHLPFGKQMELELAKELPYPKPLSLNMWEGSGSKQRRRTRLVDFVLLRTGLYYTIHYPAQGEWAELRRELLQVDCALPLVQEINQYLNTNKWGGEERRIDILKAGAVKVKQYFQETNNIQEIRGASMLLDEINRKRILNLCEKHWTPEVIVYSGGGNLLLILPSEQGRKCAEEIEKLFRQVTISAQAIAQYANVSMNDLTSTTFSNTLGWLEMKKTERQMLSIPQEVDLNELDINAYRSECLTETVEIKDHQSLSPYDTNTYIKTQHSLLCESCYKRNATQTTHYKDKSNYLVCPSCLHKVIAGKNTNIFLEEMSQCLVRTGRESAIEDSPQTLDHLVMNRKQEKQEYIAVIYADGNNMGGVVGNIKSFLSYRYFSQLVDSVTKFSLYTTLNEVLGEKEKDFKDKFQIIAVGGDDVFCIVPGSFGLQVARKIGEQFDKGFRKYGQEEEEGMTLSVGVCIAPYKTPFSTLFNTSLELLKSAKEWKKKNEIDGGSLDFMKLKSNTPYAGGLTEYRELHYKRKEDYSPEMRGIDYYQLMRPFTWDQLIKIEFWIDELKKVPASRSLVYELGNVMENMTYLEARLFYLHHVCSVKGKSEQAQSRSVFRDLLRKHHKSSLAKGKQKIIITDDPFFYDEEKNILYSPWHDLAELWDIREG